MCAGVVCAIRKADTLIETLDRPFEMGLGTIRKNLLHVADAERWWLDNWRGKPAAAFKVSPETTPIAELRGEFKEVARDRFEFIAAQSNDDLQRTVIARPLKLMVSP